MEKITMKQKIFLRANHWYVVVAFNLRVNFSLHRANFKLMEKPVLYCKSIVWFLYECIGWYGLIWVKLLSYEKSFD